MTTTVVQMTVQQFAAGVAADIRAHGHYRGPAPASEMWNHLLNPDGKCCIVASPTNYKAQLAAPQQLSVALGLPRTKNIMHWSDETDTRQVLAALDRVASS